MTDKEKFDPMQYITQINGNDYLPVAARLLWMRTEHPDAVIRVELVADHSVTVYDRNGSPFQTREAIMRATVTLPSGAESSDYGSETQTDFAAGWIEKASTKAIGRALASLGYGTQFSGIEFSGEAQAGRPVDAPVMSRQGESPVRQGGGISRMPAGSVRTGQGGAEPPLQGATARYPQQAATGPNNGGQVVGGNQGQVNQQRQGGGGVMGDPNKPASVNQMKYIADLLRGLNVDPDDFGWEGLTNGEASGYITDLKSGVIPADVADALAGLAQP